MFEKLSGIIWGVIEGMVWGWSWMVLVEFSLVLDAQEACLTLAGGCRDFTARLCSASCGGPVDEGEVSGCKLD